MSDRDIRLNTFMTVVVDIEDISITKRIKVYALDLTIFRVTLISVSRAARCPTIRLSQ